MEINFEDTYRGSQDEVDSAVKKIVSDIVWVLESLCRKRQIVTGVNTQNQSYFI